jgi:hypothetical protein
METQKVPIDDDTLLFTDIFNETEFGSEDLFSILENFNNFPPIINEQNSKTTSSTTLQDFEIEVAETSQKCKRQKIVPSSIEEPNNNNNDGQPRMSHIAVERNRRKLMNEQLSILKSLMPCFYVKRVRNIFKFFYFLLTNMFHCFELNYSCSHSYIAIFSNVS